MTLGIAGWAVGGLASLFLMMPRKSAFAQPSDSTNPKPVQEDTEGAQDDESGAFRWL